MIYDRTKFKGTSQEKIIVGSRDEYEKMMDARRNVTDIAQEHDMDDALD